jgi:hypothetical protein
VARDVQKRPLFWLILLASPPLFLLFFVDMAHSDRARAARLRKIFDAECQLTSRADHLFLEALCAQPVSASCLSAVVASPNGLQSLQTALWSNLSPAFFNGPAADVIEYALSSSDLVTTVGRECMTRVLLAIVDPPVFWIAFTNALKAGRLERRAQHAFALLLLRLLEVLTPDAATRYITFAQNPSIITPLLKSPLSGVHDLAMKIKVLSESFSTSDSDAPASTGPGGRHENDKVNFRDVAIVPTKSELVCTREPFLRASSELVNTDDYLEYHFRLLREDMLCGLRAEIAFIEADGENTGDYTTIDGLTLDKAYYKSSTNTYCGGKTSHSPWRLLLRRRQDFPHFSEVEDSREARIRWLENGGVVTIVNDQAFYLLYADEQLLAITIVHGDKETLAENPPALTIRLEDGVDVTQILLQLKSAASIKLVSLRTPLHGCLPILKGLQDLTSVPVEQDLFSKDAVAPTFLPDVSMSIITALRARPSCDLRPYLNTPHSIKLDQSQATALTRSLTQEVSLIEGPPG